ncbi:MAG: aldo/keto reductase [Planctomycetes bacterium]|nr:aldo/keto reductase [Planctomycetota bacterium]
MQYRNLGHTGQKVSALGFGCMRLPKTKDDPKQIDFDASLALFRRAVELGVNYFDTAYLYDNGDSERAIGKFLKEINRSDIFITTKNPVGHQWYQIPGDQPTGPLFRKCLEEELERMETDTIDNYLFHDTQFLTFRIIVGAEGGPLDAAKKAKEEGLIRHIGISCHDTPQNMMKIIDMAKGAIELIIMQYNLLDRKNEPVIDRCREEGIGVAIMGPVGGGKLIHPSPAYTEAVGAKSTPEVALRFVLANPGVSTAMSGMNEMAQLEENAEAASATEPLSADDLAAIDKLQKDNEALLGLYCTACGYCMPCSNGVDIPGNFAAMNFAKVHGLVDLAKQQYKRLGEKSAEHCVECGECAGKCPQHIEIQERLKEVAAELGE